MKNVKKTIIGTKGYPVDNSYSFTIETGERPNPPLAGDWLREAQLVKVVSEPYELTVNTVLDEYKTYEFITVKHNRRLHVILNDLSEDKPDIYKHII